MFCVFFVVVVIFFVHTSRADGLAEGASCKDKETLGTCRKAKHCPSYTLLSGTYRKAQICSKTENEEVVCCTDCHDDNMSEAATPTLTLDGIVWTTGGIMKYYDKCVDYASRLPYPCTDGVTTTLTKGYDLKRKCHRVDVNVGQNTTVAMPDRVDFPNLALIGFIYNGSELIHWQCQGFIISERFIVTTAHCGRFVTETGPLSYVAVGIDKRAESDKPAEVNTRANADAKPSSWQQYKAKRFIHHPAWDSNNRFNDIALVETETEIQFDVNVLPMCFADHTSDPEYVQSDILGIDNIQNMKVNLQKLNHMDCSKLFSANDVLRFTTQICYKGFNETVETCMGSSGRPIYVSGELKCMKYVVGITSFGFSCNHSETATVYTRIQTFIPWIESIVWPQKPE